MVFIATAYYDGHKIEIEYSRWWGGHTVIYDGRKVCSLSGWYSRSGDFQVIEGDRAIQYAVTLKYKGITIMANIDIDIQRNGVLIYSNTPGFIPPSPESTQTERRDREVVSREVILVVCPHCQHRNDASRRTCEKCGASI